MCFADFTGFTNTNSNTPIAQWHRPTDATVDRGFAGQFAVLCDIHRRHVVPYSIPTYYNPGKNGYNSEAYLGNNGFYTGIPGNPALYQTPNGAYTVVSFTNIRSLNAVGEAGHGLEPGDG